MGWVIMRLPEGGRPSRYVCPPGSEKAYTAALHKARVFDKRPPDNEICGNEIAMQITEQELAESRDRFARA